MATKIVVSEAPRIAQKDTVAIGGTWAGGDTITVTSPLGRTFTVTVGTSTTTAQVATLLKEGFNGETLTDTSASVDVNPQNYGEFAELTASVSSSTVTITTIDSLRGWTFTISSVTKSSTSGTVTHTAAATAARSPWHANDADNFDTGTVPVSTDEVTIDERSESLLFGLNQSAVNLGALRIHSTFNNQIGLPPVNNNIAGKPYLEYRDRWLQYGSASSINLYIGQGSGLGSSQMWLDFGAQEVEAFVWKTGPRINAGIPPLVLAGTDPNNKINLYRGDVGCGMFGKAMWLETIRQHYVDQPLNDARLELGQDFQAGTTPDWKFMGGRVIVEAGAAITAQVIGAIATIRGGTWTSLIVGKNSESQVVGQILDENSTSISLLELYSEAIANFNANSGTKSIPTLKMHSNSTLIDERGVLTLTTNGIVPVGCSIGDLNIHRPIGEAWRPV